MVKTWEDLTEHQKSIICQSVNGVGVCVPVTPIHKRAVSELSTEDLWQHFINMESDPEEVVGLYYSLFKPDFHTNMDILDSAWEILALCPPPGLNMVYALVLATTGRVEELSSYLKEYKDGLSKAKQRAKVSVDGSDNGIGKAGA